MECSLYPVLKPEVPLSIRVGCVLLNAQTSALALSCCVFSGSDHGIAGTREPATVNESCIVSVQILQFLLNQQLGASCIFFASLRVPAIANVQSLPDQSLNHIGAVDDPDRQSASNTLTARSATLEMPSHDLN